MKRIPQLRCNLFIVDEEEYARSLVFCSLVLLVIDFLSANFSVWAVIGALIGLLEERLSRSLALIA